MAYRYNNGLGIKTGFTDNNGIALDITPIIYTTAQGTSSMSGTFSVTPKLNYTFVNLQTPGTGTAQVVINATYSQIFDECTILAAGGSTTYSVVLSGSASMNTSLTLAIPANKYGLIKGVFNGTNFVFNGIATA